MYTLQNIIGGINMDRKQMVKQLGEYFEVEPKYMGVPSYAYQIETVGEIYTIDRAGKITNLAGDEVEFESIMNGRDAEQATETTGIEVSIPMDGHTGNTLRNLVNMIYSKQALIKKSLGVQVNIIEDDFCIGINEAKMESLDDFKTVIESVGDNSCPGIGFEFENRIISFKFLEGEVEAEKVEAYTHLVALLNRQAKELKHASAKVKETDNDKFTFRVFLIKIGMIGDEYMVARKVLLQNLDGNSAFRSGNPN